MFKFEKTYPHEVGISSSSILKAIKNLECNEIPMHSLLIMRHGKLAFEAYYAPYTEHTLHRMFSITKTFTALGISLLYQEGKINLDESITNYFPEYVNDNTHPWIKETTIRNMLQMRTCHASATYKVDMDTDWVESFFTVPPTHKPGTIFHYDTSAAHVMGALIEKLSGMKMLDYLRDRALKYLDFSSDSYIVSDPFGVPIGGSGLMATPMDILKVLYVLSENGSVKCEDGEVRQLFPAEFISQATSKISDTIVTGPVLSEQQGYGMQIWQNEQGGFVMYGMGGQLAISLPKQDMLIMTTADTQGLAGGNQTIYKAIYECILPALDNEDCAKEAEDAAHTAFKELMEYASTLFIKPPVIKTYTFNPSEKSYATSSINLAYKIMDNNLGFTKMRLISNPHEKKGVLTLEQEGKNVFNIPFGIDDMVESVFPVYDYNCYTGSTWLSSNVLYIRSHIVSECVGSVHFEIYIQEKDVTVFMKKIEETYFKEFNGHLYGTLISE